MRGRFGIRHEQFSNISIIFAGQSELVFGEVSRLITFRFGEDFLHLHVDPGRILHVDAHQFIDRLEKKRVKAIGRSISISSRNNTAICVSKCQSNYVGGKRNLFAFDMKGAKLQVANGDYSPLLCQDFDSDNCRATYLHDAPHFALVDQPVSIDVIHREEEFGFADRIFRRCHANGDEKFDKI